MHGPYINLDISATKVRKMIKDSDDNWKDWTYLDETKALDIK